MEDQFLGDAVRVAEDDAAHARVHQPVLVIADIDRADLFEPEVPGDLGMHEGHDEAPGGPIHVDGDVPAPLLPNPDQQLVDAREIVILAGESGADHNADSDGVLVDQGFHVLRPDHVLSGLQRHDAGLDIEVEGEFLPAGMHVGAEDHIRFGSVESPRQALFAP